MKIEREAEQNFPDSVSSTYSAALMDQVYSALQLATNGSVDPLAQQEAMAFLHQAEAMDDIMSILITIIVQVSEQYRDGTNSAHSGTHLSTDLILLAIISLKNIVQRRWNKQEDAAINSEEKGKLKMFLDAYMPINEKLLSHLSILTSKVFIKDWIYSEHQETLLPTIVRSIQDNSTNFLHNLYGAQRLYMILTEMEKVSLQKERRNRVFVNVFTALVDTVWTPLNTQIQYIYSDYASRSALPDENSPILQLLQLLKVVSKIIQLIATTSYDALYNAGLVTPRSGAATDFMSNYIVTIKAYCSHLRAYAAVITDASEMDDELYTNTPNDESDDLNMLKVSTSANIYVSSYNSLRKVVKTLSMLPVQVQLEYPLLAVPYLESWLVLFTEELLHSNRIEFVVTTCVIFLSNVVNCEKYFATRDTTDERQVQGADIVQRYLSHDMTMTLLQLLVTTLLRYNRSELDEWLDNPEEFLILQENLNKNDTMKCAGEYLYLGLVDRLEDTVSSCMIALMSKPDLYKVDPTVPDNNIQLLDGLFLCLGLSSSSVGRHINASELLQTSLLPLMSSILSNPSHGSLPAGQQLLRARMAWFLSCWLYRFDTASLPLILNVLLTVLATDNNDVVTILETVKTLTRMIEYDTVSADMLLPYSENLIRKLCAVVAHRLVVNESKGKVIDLIKLIIQRLGSHLMGILLPICNELVALWNQAVSSEEMVIMCSSILETFDEVVKLIGNENEVIYSYTIPMIAYSFGLNTSNSTVSTSPYITASTGNVYLLSEGINLLLSIMSSITTYNASLLALFNEGFASLLAQEDDVDIINIEVLRPFCLIVERFAILGRGPFLGACCNTLNLIYHRLLGSIKPVGVPFLLRPLETLFLCCPQETCTFIVQSNVLTVIMKALAASIPDFSDELESYVEAEIVIACYMSVVLRLLVLGKTDVIVGAIHQVLGHLNLPASSDCTSAMFTGIIKLAIENYDNLSYRNGSQWYRRLWIAGFLSLYTRENIVANPQLMLLDLFPDVYAIAYDTYVNESPEIAEEQFQVRLLRSMLSASIDYEDDDGGYDEEEEVTLASAEPVIRIYHELLYRQDNIATANIEEIVKQKLVLLESILSAEEYQRMMQMLAGDWST